MNQTQSRPAGSSAMLTECLVALKRHPHAIFLSSVILAALGIMGVSLLPNIYSATTTILVDPQKIPERYVASTVTSDPNARLNTLTQQVLSESRLQAIIDKENLYPVYRKKKTREELLDYVRKKTTIELKQTREQEQGLSSFSITYEDRDPRIASMVANDLAWGFINWNLDVREQQAQGTTQFLSGELEKARKSLEEQERALEDFKMKHVGSTPDQVNVNLQALTRLQSELEANTDTIARLEQERTLLGRPSVSPVGDPAALTERGRMLQEKRHLENDLWNMRQQFKDTYPDVIVAKAQLKNLNAQLAALPDSSDKAADSYDPNTRDRLTLIDKDLKRRELRQSELQTQIQSYQWKVDSVPVLETQLTELTRNYEVSREDYQSLLEKTYSARMSEELERKQQGKRFTVLDPARAPEMPVSPKRVPLIAGVIGLALILPAGVAIALYLLGGTVKSEVELFGMLPAKVPIIGTIPPIVTPADQRHTRTRTLQALTAAMIATVILVIFLLKVRPIL
ncbi:GumC family protein [Silvibacterium acidisoli]|uniref:GumC family protein n=1 Tax=Acidobacteriaceae bacterium ZG23-2 TaxID=2883246 RepID=UPI00406D359C